MAERHPVVPRHNVDDEIVPLFLSPFSLRATPLPSSQAFSASPFSLCHGFYSPSSHRLSVGHDMDPFGRVFRPRRPSSQCLLVCHVPLETGYKGNRLAAFPRVLHRGREAKSLSVQLRDA